MANDGGPTNVVGLASRVSDQLISVLPAAFLVLVIINVGVLGGVLWFINNQIGERTEMVGRLVDKCMDIALHSPPPGK